LIKALPKWQWGDKLLLRQFALENYVDALNRKRPFSQIAILDCIHYLSMQTTFPDALGLKVKIFHKKI